MHKINSKLSNKQWNKKNNKISPFSLNPNRSLAVFSHRLISKTKNFNLMNRKCGRIVCFIPLKQNKSRKILLLSNSFPSLSPIFSASKWEKLENKKHPIKFKKNKNSNPIWKKKKKMIPTMPFQTKIKFQNKQK